MTTLRDSRATSLRLKAGNDRCADCQDCDCEKCGFPDPVWASLDLGILVCEECKSLHENITKVEFKSILSIHEWTEDEWKRMEETCNADVNELYEAKVPLGYQKPTRCIHRAFREQWLMSKYIKYHFMDHADKRSPSRVDSAPTLPTHLKIGEKTGYLWKRGRDDDMFQRRWFEFVFEKASLVYYTDANKQNQRGEIFLKKVHVCLASEDKIHHPNGLQLILEEERQQIRMIYLYADNEKDMVEWFQAICIVKFWVARHAAQVSNQRISDYQILQDLNQEVIMEGSMLKTDGSARKPFKRRWFILHGTNLMYFNQELDANPKKSVKLGTHKMGFSLIMTGDYHPHWPKGGFPFLLKTPGRIFTFIADSAHERQAWYKALFRACNANPCPKETGIRPTPPPRPTTGGSRLPEPPSRRDLPLPSTPVTSPTPSLTLSPSHHVDSRITPPKKYPPSPPLPPRRSKDTAPRGSVDENTGYLIPYPSRDVPPPVIPRPPETLPNYNQSPSTRSYDYEEDDDEHTSSSDSEDNYIDLETVPVICIKVDSMGSCVKSQGFCLRIPPEALVVERGDKCFVSITPQKSQCPAITGEDQTGINANGAHVVDCRSFNYQKPLIRPLQLEVPHCAIIGDLSECKVKLWHQISTAVDNMPWREVLDDNTALSCRLKQRCVELSTLHMGSFAFLLDGPGVRGKTMQMAIFSKVNVKSNVNAGTVMAHIYLFNNISSDSVWTDIEEKEMNEGAILNDFTTSFSVYKNGSELCLELHGMEGLQMSAEQSDILTIPSKELWQSPFVEVKVKFDVITSPGKANITLRQDDVNGGDGWEEEAVFSYFSDDHECYYTSVDQLSAKELKSQRSDPGSGKPLVPGEDPYIHLEFYPPPARYSSERRDAQRKQSLRHHQASLLRHRHSPFSRTTPRVLQRAGAWPKGETSSSSTASEAGSDSSGKVSGTAIPQRLKEDLSQLLDGSAQYGNDWSMLAKYVGLEHLIHRFLIEDHPTISVLHCCEKFNITLAYLEEAMRDIDRDDAASLIRSYTISSASNENY